MCFSCASIESLWHGGLEDLSHDVLNTNYICILRVISKTGSLYRYHLCGNDIKTEEYAKVSTRRTLKKTLKRQLKETYCTKIKIHIYIMNKYENLKHNTFDEKTGTKIRVNLIELKWDFQGT